MIKRVTVFAIVVATFLVLAVPAMAFNGYRSTYTTSSACATCHNGIAGIPAVYGEWAGTKHATDEMYKEDKGELPYGSVCMGCHSSNFNPSKPGYTPSPVATDAATGEVEWEMNPSSVVPAQQATGKSAWSEGKIGCSSCHYGARTAGGGLAIYGNDPNDSAHTVPIGNMADAQICGACHSRYSYTVGTYSVAPVPYVAVDASGSPIPNPDPTTAIQPQMAIGYPMLGTPTSKPAWSPNLAAYLNVPQPGWKPDPKATSAAGLMTYWQTPIPHATKSPFFADTSWQFRGHDGSAAQYPEWRNEGHAAALTTLTSQAFWGFMDEPTKQECLECHSADFRLLKEAGKNPTSADVKYGVTCVGCHDPHDAGSIKGVWDKEFDAQLVNNDELAGNGSNLCTECHNGEIPLGSTASPGAEVHHPMREMMDGYGAIDVAAYPSVHKGKCIQCHMAPTSISRGAVQKGGNHTFEIITPVVAAEAKAKTDPAAETWDIEGMPYSACTTCHARTYQNGYGETVVDAQALWLQDTIDQRQTWTHGKVDQIHSLLDAAAKRLGYADEAAAQEALVAKAASDRTTSETTFLKAWTNVGYVESEGSFGLHNWDYSRQIVNTAIWEAESVEAEPAPAPWSVSFKANKTSVKKNTKVKLSGTIAPAEAMTFGHATVTIQKYTGGAWKKWKKVNCSTAGTYSISVKMTKTGTYKLRAMMPAYNAHNMKQGVSGKVSVKVKKK
jgi:hypothetical protein